MTECWKMFIEYRLVLVEVAFDATILFNEVNISFSHPFQTNKQRILSQQI